MNTLSNISTPVLFLIFNRPDTTQKVFDIIRQVKPSKLFIAADGAREGNSNDERLCTQVRNITEQVDWECDVKYLYRDKNLGCRVAISSGIDWFFEYVNEGIILEDDCLPSKSLFSFHQELLEKYRDNDKVMQINGEFYLDGVMEFENSYYFSTLNGCWGWATWKRAWDQFDSKMSGYANFKEKGGIDDYFKNKDISDWMISYLDEAVLPACNTWSSQWAYAIIKSGGLSITPTTNLVKNIGFFGDGTTGSSESFKLYMEFDVGDIDDIEHPSKIDHNETADELHFNTVIKITDPRLSKKYRIMKMLIPVWIRKIIKRIIY